MEPVANAAWGGRAADGTYPLPVTEDPEAPVVDQAVTVSVSRRDLTSMIVLAGGTLCGIVGGVAVAGWGGGLLAAWATAIPVALMMGGDN